TVTDANGCQNSDAADLTVNALPTVDLGADQTICADGSATFDAGAGFSAYSWSTGDATQSITVNTAGTYSVTVTDVNGCQNSDETILNINTLPVVDLGADQTICADDSVTFDAGVGFSIYEWSTGSTMQIITVNTTNTYSVTVTDVNGCQMNGSVTLTVNALPAVDLGADRTICADGSAVLDAGDGFSAYSWSTGDASQAVTVNTAGTYSVTVTDANGCQNSDMIVLDVNELPTVDIGTDMTICADSLVTFNAGAGFSTYSWSTGDATQTITINTAGTYSVTVTDANGCQNSDAADIIVNALPTVDLGGDQTICANASATFNAGAGFSAYSWSTGATTRIIAVNTANTYSVTVTDANGCQNSDAAVLSINELPTVDISEDQTICADGSATFDAGTGYNSYEWSIGDTTRMITVSRAGTYSVTITDANGCQNSDESVLTVNALPAVDLGEDFPEICENDELILEAGEQYEAPFERLWSDGSTGPVYTATQTGEIWLRVTDINGCVGYDTVYLTVNELPVVNLGEDVVICDRIKINAGDFAEYEWHSSRGIEYTGNPITVEPVHLQPDTITVTVTDYNHCTASDMIVILPCDVDRLFKDMTNTITPNGDGHNDVWNIPNIDLFENAVLEIFDRWGRLVYRTTNVFEEPWDGTSKGKELPMDSYYYVIELNKFNLKPLVGTVNLIR
ncbi:MAG: gliding motility-associated C-terminal domain-containing protein, partial [Bacteroidales bacterium]|nr:gliding motility-associated C-terminal domain-containing protein [Bacteroidales bacterium]